METAYYLWRHKEEVRLVLAAMYTEKNHAVGTTIQQVAPLSSVTLVNDVNEVQPTDNPRSVDSSSSAKVSSPQIENLKNTRVPAQKKPKYAFGQKKALVLLQPYHMNQLRRLCKMTA